MVACPKCSETNGFHLAWCRVEPTPLQKQPSRSTCLPTAFAMALNVDVKEIIDALGGNAERDFHVMELTWLAFSRHGVVFTPFDADIQLDPPGDEVLHVPTIAELLLKYSGVLCGQGAKGPHAVYWDHKAQCRYDPNFTVGGDFQIDTFWIRVDPR